nr:MaoC/PaaZ C-terminal domain-containing protein [Bradyrhizobium sp. BRP22]
MTSGYFEDVEVGDSQKAGPYSVSKEEIIQFAKRYDPRPFHIDEAAAARSVFGGLSASAAHTLCDLHLANQPITASGSCDRRVGL